MRLTMDSSRRTGLRIMSDSHKEALCRALSIIADTKPTEHAADQTSPRLWPRRRRQDGANEHSCAANRRLTAFTPSDNKFTLPSHRGVIVDVRGQRGRSERRETGAAMQLTDETVGPPTRDPVCGRHLFAVGDGRRGTRALRRHRCASRFCFAAPPQTHSPRRSTPISRPSVQKA